MFLYNHSDLLKLVGVAEKQQSMSNNYIAKNHKSQFASGNFTVFTANYGCTADKDFKTMLHGVLRGTKSAAPHKKISI